jgi:hypothetical protein
MAGEREGEEKRGRGERIPKRLNTYRELAQHDLCLGWLEQI